MKLQKLLLSLAFIFLFSLSADAQCAMCKAVADSGTKAGSTMATGLNGGILYLMIFPYLILTGLGIAFYRHKKAQSTEATPEE